MNYSEKQQEFIDQLLGLVDSFEDILPPYLICFEMVKLSCVTALCKTPNQLGAIKTILYSIDKGIELYEEIHI